MSGQRLRRVLVTGISRGIGAALARTIAAKSPSETMPACELCGVYRRSQSQAVALAEAFATEQDAVSDGSTLRLFQADLSDAAQVRVLIDDLKGGGPLDAVVLNAGISYRAAFGELEVMGADPVRAQLQANLEAPLLLLRALLAAPGLASGASVVFVSSNLARHGLAGKVAYCAAKAGLEGAVRALAKELGAKKIRVNAVAPGLLKTDMTAELGAAGYAAYAPEVPLGRVGSAQDAANAIAFLLSDEASYISGQTLDVDGGWGA